MTRVIKRDGTIVNFTPERIYKAIHAASTCVNENTKNFCDTKVKDLICHIQDDYIQIAVEEIQDLVVELLMKSDYTKTAQRYIIYREARKLHRENAAATIKTYNEIIEIEDNDRKHDNANINGNIPAGQAMKIFSLESKKHALNILIKPLFSKMHNAGDFHIHDLDFYTTKTTNCLHTDLLTLFKNGIEAIEGDSRPPKRLDSCTALASVSIQSSQNEQFGGQSLANFDYAFALGVRRSYVDELAELLEDIHGYDEALIQKALTPLKDYAENNSILSEEGSKQVFKALNNIPFLLSEHRTLSLLDKLLKKKLNKRIKQSMEAFVHNSIMMHSRGGGQVPFLSVNLGTDYSPEGRLVTKSLLNAIYEGVGKKGRTAIFPIVIFKVKDGINFSEEDFKLFLNDPQAAFSEKINFNTPNFDLFLLSLKVMAKRHFPTYLFLDSTFNKSVKWDINDSNRWKNELSVMGCRTRIWEDLHGENTSIGRGNSSFTTINLPRLAIKSNKDIYKFFDSLDDIMNKAAEQLFDRFCFQKKAYAKQFPYIMKNKLMLGADSLNPEDKLGDILNHFSLSIGFVGLSECLVSLLGKHHGESKIAQELGLKIVSFMREKCDRYKEEYNLNYSLFATPAEGLCLSALNKDQKEFGIIEGVTDKAYYTNSFHVSVSYKITAKEKIDIEAPYHELCNAGHISYVESDDAIGNNILAYAKIIKYMKDKNMGYVAINHPDNRCLSCGFDKEAIKETCPKCGSKNIEKISRITGYLTGDINRWNSGKRAELNDRISHC